MDDEGSKKDSIIAFIIVITAVVIMFCASFSINSASADDTKNTKAETFNRFKVVETGTVDYTDYKIVYDVDTGVMYYWSTSRYNVGSLSPLYDTDGKLLLYGVGE